MLNFCTLFDSNYLSRGLALYHSLEKVCPQFHLYIFAFDEECLHYFTQEAAAYPHCTVISLKEFEDEALLAIKPQRSIAEYCWTCTSSTILYCIQQFQLAHCTYIDADIIFYSNPQVLIDEMGSKDVLISEHRYTPAYNQTDYSGIYCVQFMCFKNTANGLHILNWWRERCLEWCFARLENGKFGDQKYLDDWTTRFTNVHVMQHRGGGVAPWNVQQYTISSGPTLKHQGILTALIFFHFHGVKFYTNKQVSYCGPLYELSEAVKDNLYQPYVQQLLQQQIYLHKKGFLNNSGACQIAPSKFSVWLQFIKSSLQQIKKGKANPLQIKWFNFSRHNHFNTTDKF
ncbi:MAG: glycosyl transferase [Sphingobacteriales bacterium]|nr:MAG: glycosyl transferase [Sphingobacteriales bacterium]